MATYHSTAIADHWKRQRGLTLVELMIACTLGLLIVLVMSYILMNSLQSRNELIKTSRQIENGRYAMDELRKEIQLAGFYGSFAPMGAITPTTPDPCAITRDELEFEVPSTAPTVRLVPVGVQGYTELEASPSCVPADRLAGTDILVVRRVSTQHIEIDPAGNNSVDATVAAGLGNAFYLQVSNCLDLPSENAFVVSNNSTDFTLHKVTPGASGNCTLGARSEVRRYITNIFYISSCNNCNGAGDGVPTLKMVEVSPGEMVRPIAEGIQNMQIEYGRDTDNDGTPDQFVTAMPDPTATPTQWRDVVAVKVFLLVRNAEPTPGYNDTKTYVLSSDGTNRVVAPADRFRRQAYVATTMAHNLAGRR